VVDADEVEAERGVAHDGPGGVAREDVHFARLQRGEALLRGERRVAHLVRVAEHRRGHGAAEIDVEAAPDALRIRLREAGKARVHAALQEAAVAHGVQSRLRKKILTGEDQPKKNQNPHKLSPRKSLTSAIWSGCISVGAWPTPLISTTRAL